MPRALLLLLLVACSASSPDPARELAMRIYPPCCKRQVLADHDSAPARALRDEIEARVAAGEPIAEIERSLVARYGEDIIAVGPGGDRRGYIAGIVGGVILIGLLALVLVVRRGRRRLPLASTLRREDPEDAARLDDELAASID